MTLDEAIKHTEEVTEEKEKEAKEWHENQVRKCKLIPFPFSEMDYTRENECKQCAKEHRQLTKWLKELKQLREQEPCEDAISRKAVLDVIEREEFKGDAISEIEKLSSVIPQPKIIPIAEIRFDDDELHKIAEEAINNIEIEPKTGHWIVASGEYGDSAYICECSECKDTVWAYKDADKEWNYCPSCGCRMTEGSE